MDMRSLIFFLVAFGELEISSVTLGFMIGMAVFIFAAVGVSSFNLIQAVTERKDEKQE